VAKLALSCAFCLGGFSSVLSPVDVEVVEGCASRCVRAPRRKCEKLLRIRHGREWESMRMLTSAGVGSNRRTGNAAREKIAA
jgi:hypothetical protein